MSSRDTPNETARVLSSSAEIRRLALTPEQRARREAVERRSAAISAGVKRPASGIFGKVKSEKAA